MRSILSTILWLSLISTCASFDQLSHVADLLHRIIREGLAEDVATTDLYFVNFEQPEYIELQELVLERLRQTSTIVPMFMNARNDFARNRFFALVGAADEDEYEDIIDVVFYSAMSLQQLLENSLTTHVIAVVLNKPNPDYVDNQLEQTMATTLGRFRSHSFILVASTIADARIYTVGRNLYLEELQWNDSFHELFLNRPFVSIEKREIFAALLSRPSVDFRDGHFEGLDVIVFSTIMDHLNLSFEVILVSHRDLTEMEKEFEGLLGSGQIDAIMNRGEVLSAVGVEIMIPQRDGLCILTPKSRRRYLFYHLLQPFEISSWLFMCLFLIVCALASALWSKLFHQNLILTLFCGHTISDHQMQRLERFTVLGCSLLLMVLIEAYLTKFIFHMTTYRFEKDPQTIEEFVDSPHMLLELDFFADDLVQLRSSLKSKIITVSELIHDVINTSYGYAVHCSDAEALLGGRAQYDRFMFGPNVRPSFHMVPEKLETTANYYVFSPYSHYFANFKLCLEWLFDSGLTDFWEKNVERKYYVNPAYEFTDSVVLDLERLMLLWIIYGIGILISVVVFTVEMVLVQVVMFISLKVYL